ncbi:uncharacterized protein GGS22DRAFT_162974 [Annulohypoxylon maeteangense]|uniref:uncharacterized protein n=1 Tax=Annulohypoxylon maeteangense TaxID=1927788 RepID=UPI0020077FA5|nr:uncharacterized protein GGS22DRAFT_162974 [Annulohypoxylon maeteangense]KAI0885178.1 hypothetical protein GGS22DRAFT_162974 [Annulohypoxylon maeteangense]
MSGVELSGLILGGLPLVIAALEFYQTSISRRKYRTTKSDILKIEQSLKYHQVLLRSTLKSLLRQSLPESEIEELLENPTGSKWQDKEIESSLRESLGPRGYIVFSETTGELFETVSSLQKSLRTIAAPVGLEGFRLLPRSYRLSDTTKAIQRLEKHNERLRQLVENLPKTRGQVIENISEAFTNAGGIQEIARVLEDIANARSRIPPGADDDVHSMYSVESEIGDEGASLSYLPLSLQDVNEPKKSLKEQALLDTGANACAISINLALQLDLNIKTTEETVVKTAALKEELPVAGQVHLNLRWKENEENKFGTRMWVYVVYGLTHPILLSHDFTQKHPEVWSIAKTIIHLPKQLNVIWFNKLDEKQKKAEEAYRARCLQRNTAISDAEKQERLIEQDQLLASSVQSSTTGSSATSTSGLTPNATSSATSNSASASASTGTTSNLSGSPVSP